MLRRCLLRFCIPYDLAITTRHETPFGMRRILPTKNLILYVLFEVGFVGKNANNVIPLLVKSFLTILLT
jgi:hypothetical protein